ncbi:Eukaryotic translation initiation factor 3 subunit E [Irineochytrium annulatum]|nr:Eukaryotic translation initiation factor 3 subunit E [Irineochytrium annulatum]
MLPPSFADIGKPVHDLLGKDFPVGSAKLEVNTTTANGIKFTVAGNKDNKSGHINSELKTKYTDKARGLTVTEHWNTSNVLGAQVEIVDQIAKGLKLDLTASLLPASGQKNAKAGFEFKQANIFTRSSLDLFKGPTLHGDAVIGSDGFLVGGDVAYDVSDARITRYNAAVGYIAPEYSVSIHALNKFGTFSASYFHKINKEVEAGAKATWNRASDAPVTIEVGTKYVLDSDAFLKAKMNNIGQLGLGYTQVLRKGIKLSLGGSFDTNRLNENVHKVGLSVIFDRIMAEFDLSPRIGQYLDRHMVLPLLEFLSLKNIYRKEDLVSAKFELLSETNMIDFANQIYQQMHQSETNSPGYEEKRNGVLRKYEELQENSSAIMAIITDPAVIQQLKQDKLANVQFLEEKYNYRPEMLSTLYEFARVQYSVGNYSGSAEMLYHFRILSTDYDQNLNALWGKLAAEILTQNWETAMEDLNKLKDQIDKLQISNTHQLQQRTWLIHWSLFVYFNHPKGRDAIIDLFFQPHYINSIQTACPWILRYLTTAVIINKRRRSVLKDLIKIIEQESVSYKDPVTEFIECLYINFDFDGAQKKLQECDAILSNDFFLVATRTDFIENARLFIFETYCRIHQCIDIKGLSEKLNLDEVEGEKWIVNLIRDARMDAKIDAETNTVVMGTQSTTIYQQVIERTRALSFRTSLLSSNIEKREVELSNRRAGNKDVSGASGSGRGRGRGGRGGRGPKDMITV